MFVTPYHKTNQLTSEYSVYAINTFTMCIIFFQLHKKVSDLTCELVELKEEAEKYEELAEHAEQLAETVKVTVCVHDDLASNVVKP